MFWKVSIINSFASRCALTSHPYFIEQWFWLGSGHLYVHELKPVKGHYEYLQSIKCKYFADWSLNFEIALQCPTETQKSFRITCIHCCFEKNCSREMSPGYKTMVLPSYTLLWFGQPVIRQSVYYPQRQICKSVSNDYIFSVSPTELEA